MKKCIEIFVFQNQKIIDDSAWFLLIYFFNLEFYLNIILDFYNILKFINYAYNFYYLI